MDSTTAASQSPVADALSPNIPSTPTPAGRGRPRGAVTGTGAKRGRKPRGGATGVGTTTPRLPSQDNTTNASSASPVIPTPQFSRVHWNLPTQAQLPAGTSSPNAAVAPVASGSTSTTVATPGTIATPPTSYSLPTSIPQLQRTPSVPMTYSLGTTTTSSTTPTNALNFVLPGSTPNTSSALSSLGVSGLLNLSGLSTPMLSAGTTAATAGLRAGMLGLTRTPGVGDDEGDGDDEMLPAMADDDYSAQLSWQSQSKDNLKVLMDNFSPEQYERFEAYRRHALPKQAVRKVIQQTLGQQVSQPVAQIIAGFAKVFVGEIIEKAREVQTRRGESGPLSPDHLREAYRMYQSETGRVGSARPLRAKRLFYR